MTEIERGQRGEVKGKLVHITWGRDWMGFAIDTDGEVLFFRLRNFPEGITKGSEITFTATRKEDKLLKISNIQVVS